jgi:hypothetical protein
VGAVGDAFLEVEEERAAHLARAAKGALGTSRELAYEVSRHTRRAVEWAEHAPDLDAGLTALRWQAAVAALARELTP